MDWTEGRFTDLLPELQAVAARHAGPLSYDHPGQLAWGSVFDGAAPAVIAGGDGYGILESPHWLQVGGSPGRAADVTKWARSRASGFSAMALDGPLASSLAAAREQGAATGIVRPRGDQGYPVPVRLYRSIGFTDQARTREYRFPGPGGLPVR